MSAAEVVVVTGASSGVGASITRKLAASGRTVAAIARSPDALARVASAPGGGRIVPVAVDITDAQAIRRAIDGIERDIGPIATLINNTGVFDLTEFHHQDLAMIDRIIATNLSGTMYCTHAALAHMLPRRQGRIIGVASVAGTRGIPGQATYCASKHGMVGFFEALAQELQPQGILVTTLCPGGIDTPLWSRGDDPAPGSVRYPGDREALIAPEEIAELIEFLLSRPVGTVYKRLVFFPANEWH
ncbi:MAG: SDR family oxidoreductase [Planctomycetes bacterium]|nr:SDR family oxidoreductase [Planctomycetota bacterium]